MGPTEQPAPNGLPACQAWCTIRNSVMDRVLEGFSRGGDPTVVALVGRNGSGKSTAAACFVNLWRGIHQPQEGETEIQARVRSHRVQASFPDGVLWLRVGEGGGSTDRIASLMRTLAQKLYEEVLDNSVDDPAMFDGDISGYIKRVVAKGKGGKRGLCCLVVVDDVWETAVVSKLRETGMWVLVTTRHDLVGVDDKVLVDKLLSKEAERLLRGAAGLQSGVRLPDAAYTILDHCDYVAMDVAFVGKWNSVRAGADGVAKDKQAWGDALYAIEDQVAAIRNERGNAHGMDDREINRLAILRAGFRYLGQEDVNAGTLYAALMVLPNGYEFTFQDAAVLLHDHEVHAEHQMQTVKNAMAILEQWSVLRKEKPGLYHMHDVHLYFVREHGKELAGIRQTAIRRWTSHISCWNVVSAMDVYTLAGLWRALEAMGGEGWQVSRPYDAELLGMSHADQSKRFAVHLVGDLYSLYNYNGVEVPMRQLIEDCVMIPGADPHVHMAAVYYLGQGLWQQGYVGEYKENTTRLSELVASVNPPEFPFGISSTQQATVISKYGIIALTAGRSHDTEAWLRKALGAQEAAGLGTSSQATPMLDLLGCCVQDAGRLVEAEGIFKHKLAIQEANEDVGDLPIASTLNSLGRCVRDMGRPREAEGYIRRELDIRVSNMEPDDLSIAYTLYELGQCAETRDRPEEGEDYFRRVLEIREARLGTDGLIIADTLNALGQCIRGAGRQEEAATLFERELRIRQGKHNNDGMSIANTLYVLGQCARETGRPEAAVGYFNRQLRTLKEHVDPSDMSIANTLNALGQCSREAGQQESAEAYFRRELHVRDTNVESDDISVANNLHILGQCVREAGRPEEAKGYFERELVFREATMERDQVSVANTLYALGCCHQEADRPAVALPYFTRELQVREETTISDDLSVANALHALGCCIQDAGRPGEAKPFFERHLRILEEIMDPGDLPIADALNALGKCLQATRRTRDAQAYFKREREIRAAIVDDDDLGTLHTDALPSRCRIRTSNRSGGARAFLKRRLNNLQARCTLLGSAVRKGASRKGRKMFSSELWRRRFRRWKWTMFPTPGRRMLRVGGFGGSGGKRRARSL